MNGKKKKKKKKKSNNYYKIKILLNFPQNKMSNSCFTKKTLTEATLLILTFFLHFRNYSNFWSRFWDYRYGNCYEFNGGKDDNYNDQAILETHSTGPFGGKAKLGRKSKGG